MYRHFEAFGWAGSAFCYGYREFYQSAFGAEAVFRNGALKELNCTAVFWRWRVLCGMKWYRQGQNSGRLFT